VFPIRLVLHNKPIKEQILNKEARPPFSAELLLFRRKSQSLSQDIAEASLVTSVHLLLIIEADLSVTHLAQTSL